MIAVIAASLFLVLSAILIIAVLKLSAQLGQRLDSMNQCLQSANSSISQSLGNATSIFGSVQKALGSLQESNRQIIDISKDIASLQELLRAPKLRGQIGETMLENLLDQVLPKGHFRTQHRFKTGEAVDAVIVLGERLVPVDAKFSLENFVKMAETTDEAQKQTFRKKFAQDIKNRVDEIASKYILPAENTYDFALMYIPAENVYYEVTINEDLFSYCIQRHVIPVSPNTFYAYLQVICLGLKGFKIEENAKQILKNLSMLSIEMQKFREDFELVGKHIQNANTKYEDSQRRLDRFSDKLVSIQDKKQIEP
ncbi:MAG: DNA recombination protein RmuC [Candidatus Omnitrophica bacterium]|nr:DNA recombination protein RmuC [Candidatus Omnitrophota bacterium]